MDEPAYIEALYGSAKAYDVARRPAAPLVDRALKWMLWPGLPLFALVSMILAVVMRRLHFGVWF